jgi:hypothetical protein
MSSTSSSSALKVNQQGQVEAIAFHSGMTRESAWGEHLDNSEDALATKIVVAEVHLPVETGKTDSKTKKPVYENAPAFCHGDNGKGFTMDELDAHHHLHNIKPASSKHGRMGYGGTAAECYESQLEGISMILTKSVERDQLVKQIVDWKLIHETGKGVGPAHPASASDNELWDKLRSQFKIDNVFHGTLIFVQIPSKFKDELAPTAIAPLVHQIGTTYFKYLATGKTIAVFDRDGKEYPVAAVDSLSWDDISDEPNVHLPKNERSFKKENTIEMWKNNDTGKGVAFYLDYQKRGGKNVPVYRGLTKNSKGKVVPTNKGATGVYPPKNSTKMNTITMRSSYKASGDPSHPTNSGGKLRLQRNGRITQSYDPPTSRHGHEQRYGIEGSNHVIELDYTCDWFAPPEVDKSRANVANLDPEFWMMVNELVMQFANRVSSGLLDHADAHTAATSLVRGADSGSEAYAESESEPDPPAPTAESVTVPTATPPPESKVVTKLNTEDDMQKVLSAEMFAEWKREAFALQSRYLV